MITTALQLLETYFPTPKQWMVLGLPSLLLAFSFLYIAGWMKKRFHWRTGYSRKLFHFLVFFTVSVFQANYSLTGTIVFGTATSLVVFYALLKADRHLMYEAMAREKDAPKRSHYIIMPYLATLAGGVFANLLFTPIFATIGYLVTGFGDAVGEPIGTAFGKHQYRVPTLTKVVSYRSLEGSAAVFVASLFAVIIGCLLLNIPLSIYVCLIALAVTFVEAVSPHGWDNFTTQLIGAAMAWWLF